MTRAQELVIERMLQRAAYDLQGCEEKWMIIVILLVVLAYLCSIWLLRLLIAGLVLVLAASLSVRVRRTACQPLKNARRDLVYDRKPTREECRMMRASLRLAIRQTALRSLFPSVVAQADAMVPQGRVSVTPTRVAASN